MFRRSMPCRAVRLHFVALAVAGLLATPDAILAQNRLLLHTPHLMVPEGIYGTLAIGVGDLDGDGDLDALVGNAGLFAATGAASGSDGERLYLNDGHGAFADATATHLLGYAGSVHDVALGDVDGDGDLDALFATAEMSVGSCYRCIFWYEPGGPVLWLNDGAGEFTTASSAFPGYGPAGAVALADVDGDGDLDAAVGSLGAAFGPRIMPQQSRLFRNDGAGVFTDVTATHFPQALGETDGIAAGDVDGDGDVDLLLGNGRYGYGAWLWLNDGSGVFTDATAGFPGAGSPVELADLDGDGDLDALSGDLVLANGGAGTFQVLGSLPTWGSDYALDDVDADGDVDVVAAMAGYATGAQNRLFLNDGGASFTEAPANLPQKLDYTWAVALADFDGDGDPDNLVGNYNEQNWVWLNDGAGRFWGVDPDVRFPAESDISWDATMSDVDGDDDLDLLVGTWLASGRQSRLYLNDGSGVFADASTGLPPDPDPTTAIVCGDVDGDGDVDAFLGKGQGAFQNRLWLGDGTGGFTDATATRLPAVQDQTADVELRDIDADGDLDVLIGNAGGNALWLNDGGGAFVDASGQIPATVADTRAVTLGDVDGDGDPDALLGNGPSQPNELWLNDGTGAFTNAISQVPRDIANTRAVALGDVDGDLDLDAFIGTDWRGPNRLWLNDGTGVFTDGSSQIPGGSSTRDVVLADLDEDGDLDVLLGIGYGRGDLRNGLWLNDGTGRFMDASASHLPTVLDTTIALAAGDVDGDRDLDIFVANQAQDFLYINTARKLRWRGVPRIGKPLTFDVGGAPGAGWLLVVSLRSALYSLPFGTIHLDPWLALATGGGFFDPAGRSSVTFAVPAVSRLVGQSLYWQAFMAPQIALTNLEVTTFTDL